MIIGVPKELKDHESRVGIVPSGVKALVDAGHRVLVESRAGELSSIDDEDYKQAGAQIVGSAAEVWQKADMVVKVKEPIPSEFQHLRKDLVLHLPASRSATRTDRSTPQEQGYGYRL